MSGTSVPTPTVGGHPISGRVGGAVGQGAMGAGAGAVAGAEIGAAGGPIGMVAGAVIGGIIGVVGGYLGGAQADKSAYYKKVASKWAKIGKDREAAIARNNFMREFRMRRAAMMMGIGAEQGGTRSSAPQGARDALGAQFAFGDAYAEGQYFIQDQYSKYMRKAGKSAQAAQTIFATTGAVLQGAQMFASAYSPSSAPASGSTPGIATSPVSSQGQPYAPGYGGPRYA